MRDYYEQSEILIVIKEMVGDVCARLRKHKEKCQELFLGIGYSDRELQPGFTARIKFVRPEHSTDLLSDLARQEFCKRWHGEPVRSVNVTAGKISPAAQEQLELFFDGDERKHELDAALDRLRDRFGKKLSFMLGQWLEGRIWRELVMSADIKGRVLRSNK